MREREDANRTRETGNRNEVEGVVPNTLNAFRGGDACRVLWFTLVGFIDWLGLLRLVHLMVERDTAKWAESKLALHGEAGTGLRNGHSDLARAMRTPDAIEAIQSGTEERGERDNSNGPATILRLHEKYARKEDGETEESDRLHFSDSAIDCLAECHRPNENKMSDGGRERASLGVEVWKPS